MTDRAVQPEAPTTESGRALLMLAETHNLDCADPAACCFPAYIADGERIVAIEAEAYRQGWDANTATSFGNRAASQERPHTTEADALLREWVEHHQPEGYEGIQDCSDINDRTEAYLAAAASQERPHGGWKVPGDPSIDGTDFATDEELNASIRRGVAQERPPIDVVRLAKAMALVYVTGHPIHEAVEHWESYRTDATELIAAYGAAEELDD
jgi:hypothetical protein